MLVSMSSPTFQIQGHMSSFPMSSFPTDRCEWSQSPHLEGRRTHRYQHPVTLSIDKLLMDLLNLILMLPQSFSPSLLFFLIINVRQSKEIKELLLSHIDEILVNGSFLKIKGKD